MRFITPPPKKGLPSIYMPKAITIGRIAAIIAVIMLFFIIYDKIKRDKIKRDESRNNF